MGKKEIEVIARGLVLSGDKVLLCENKNGNHYFLPGGHTEFGESLKMSLVREIKEEMGISCTVGDMVGVLENTFKAREDVHCEISVIFSVELSQIEVSSLEEHIAFHWVNINTLSSINLLPSGLPELIATWFEDRQVFFGSTH